MDRGLNMFGLMSSKYQVGAEFRAFIKKCTIRCILIAQLSAALISVVSSTCRNEKVILTRMDTRDSVELPFHFLAFGYRHRGLGPIRLPSDQYTKSCILIICPRHNILKCYVNAIQKLTKI